MICSQLAQADSDLVNERLTASTEHMEQQWRVDCEATLNALSHRQPEKGDRDIALALEKCSYIHQPPGEPDRGGCNDYAALLRAWNRGDAAAITTELENSARCRALKELQ